MFNFFKNTQVPSPEDMMMEMGKKWYDSLTELQKVVDDLQNQKFMPIVTQGDDVTTVTFKGPNVTTTITTKTVELPAVLKQYGLTMPTAAKKKASNAKS
jgi:hypothetical protein